MGAGGSVCVRENASRQKGTGVCVCIHVLQAKGKWGGGGQSVCAQTFAPGRRESLHPQP